jgi:hypothetical protein
MNQVPLFPQNPDENLPGRAHRDAPDTEREAARRIMPVTGSQRRKVLDALRTAGVRGLTDWEIVEKCDLLRSSAGARRNELVRMGFAYDSGKRRREHTGANAIVWFAS